MSNLFDDLVSTYKGVAIAFPDLKPVTLSQWIIESGRGTSRLATEHLNFGGLKWRDEMVGFATPVEFDAHDGLDFYCKFASLEAFVIGYWKFLSREPYKGWQDEAQKSPEAFFRFIGPIYNPAGDIYVNQVLSLVDEATRRLNDAPQKSVIAPTPQVAGIPVVIVIDPGHGGSATVGGSSPNNANSPAGEKEKDWTLDVAKRTKAAIMQKALAVDKNIKVFLTRETDINLGLSARANVAKAKGAKLFLAIHFNGFNKKIRGVETLISNINVNPAEDRKLAESIQENVLDALHKIDPTTKSLPNYDRGVKGQSLGVLNDVALGNSTSVHPCRACLVEIEFMDVLEVEMLFKLSPPNPTTTGNRQLIAEALADALISQS